MQWRESQWNAFSKLQLGFSSCRARQTDAPGFSSLGATFSFTFTFVIPRFEAFITVAFILWKHAFFFEAQKRLICLFVNHTIAALLFFYRKCISFSCFLIVFLCAVFFFVCFLKEKQNQVGSRHFTERLVKRETPCSRLVETAGGRCLTLSLWNPSVVDCLDPTCSGRGVCVQGECHCFVGWGGPGCESPRASCMDQCSGHGAFLADTGTCSCDPNWTGHDCSTGESSPSSDHKTRAEFLFTVPH